MSGRQIRVRGEAVGNDVGVSDAPCELCEAARLTEWFYEDEHCWIAECEACFVPMVVWKVHAVEPSEELKAAMWALVTEVASARYGFRSWIDDNMRTIPTHYHAHARRRF